jgi:hypothetical protein
MRSASGMVTLPRAKLSLFSAKLRFGGTSQYFPAIAPLLAKIDASNRMATVIVPQFFQGRLAGILYHLIALLKTQPLFVEKTRGSPLPSNRTTRPQWLRDYATTHKLLGNGVPLHMKKKISVRSVPLAARVWSPTV